MQEIPDNSAVPVTQWSQSEIDILFALAPHSVRRAQIAELFADRSYTAVKTKLSKVRKDMGIGRGRQENLLTDRRIMLDRDDPGINCTYPQRWAAQSASANAAFLAALGGCHR